MRLARLQRHWNEFGRRDPMWAALTVPGKDGRRWTVDEFLQTGRDEIAAAMASLDACGVPVARDRALDFGCGAGRLSRALADHFAEVVGVDIAPSMIELARNLHADTPSVRFLLNASSTLDELPSSSVDFVYSRLVLQHMRPRHIRRYLAEFARVLRPGGVAMFQVPSNETAPVRGPGIKTRLPLRMVAAIRFIRRLGSFPRMEVHGLARPDVEQRLRNLGMRVVSITDDRVHGADTPGYRYCAVKIGA